MAGAKFEEASFSAQAFLSLEKTNIKASVITACLPNVLLISSRNLTVTSLSMLRIQQKQL